MTPLHIEYIPIDCMHIDGHVDQFTNIGEFHQRPERTLELNPLNHGRSDAPIKCWLGAIQKEVGLIAAVNHHSCNRLRLTQDGQWLHSHPSKDEVVYFKIPLRTGCDGAARSNLIQNAIGALTDSRVPKWLFEGRVQCGKSRIGG